MCLRSAETVCTTDYSSLLARDHLLREGGPAGVSGVGYVNRCKCPAVHLDEFAAGSSELVNSNCAAGMYQIHSSVCFHSASMNWLLVCFSRPVSRRSLLMDLMLDHIGLLPGYHPLLNDDVLIVSAFHPVPLTSFPTDSYYFKSGMYL